MTVIGVDVPDFPLDSLDSPPDEFFPVGELRNVLPRAEHLVLIVPDTPQTAGLIGEKELALMPQGAILINIGRGPLVDEPALVEALTSGHLGGAGLDVFVEEPLPRDSPFWEMPNVLVSPHSGSTSDQENRRITDLFCQNLKRFLAGQPLINVLDPDRLY
jgi:phosphoglycerate dehydrogenase-like enzyme